MSDAADVIARLRQEWSLDFVRVRRVLAALAADADESRDDVSRDDVSRDDVSRLVAASGLPRRDVEAVVAAVPDELRAAAAADVQESRTAPPAEEELANRLARPAARRPPTRWWVDHVPATLDTMVRRARYLASEYDLAGASVLCLGDADLTALGVGLAAPDAELTVVDIDEPVLDHTAASADDLGFPVTVAWADLRLALPPSLTATADLVFTDPPYTTEGIRLFLERGLEALRPTGHERLAFCFGVGERHLVKALEVQSVLADLRLALEAVLPRFNHYAGAEAIGARSDLYICRPTTKARVGEPGRPPKTVKIYTRGPAAEEAPTRLLPELACDAAMVEASLLAESAPVLVGAGWPDPAVPLPEYFHRLASWATAARPGPFPFPGIPVISTWPDHGAVVLRVLLLAAPERAVLVVPRRHVPDPDLLAGLLAAAYTLTPVPTGPGGDPAVLSVTRHDRPPADAAQAVLRHILLHPGAKLVNAWRDALIAAARSAGGTMTRNEARARIAADTLPPSLRRLRLWELPLSLLRRLPADVARSTTPS